METTILQLGVCWGYMGGCQKYDPFLGTLNMGIIWTILGSMGIMEKKMETIILGLYIPD